MKADILLIEEILDESLEDTEFDIIHFEANKNKIIIRLFPNGYKNHQIFDLNYPTHKSKINETIENFDFIKRIKKLTEFKYDYYSYQLNPNNSKMLYIQLSFNKST